jgi:hypothetical protein
MDGDKSFVYVQLADIVYDSIPIENALTINSLITFTL